MNNIKFAFPSVILWYNIPTEVMNLLKTMFPFWAAILANVLAQILKPFFHYLRTRDFNPHYTIACGGFPSSHTSTVTALVTAVAIVEGIHSTLFAVTMIFALIVIYDAVNVRYYAGKNIQLTKQLISDLEETFKLKLDDPIYFEKMKQVLGHRYVEALGGLILGIVVAIIMALLNGFL